MANYDFYQHKQCEYFPCHSGADPETLIVVFCPSYHPGYFDQIFLRVELPDNSCPELVVDDIAQQIID